VESVKKQRREFVGNSGYELGGKISAGGLRFRASESRTRKVRIAQRLRAKTNVTLK
jgi:hypothetical protein